MNVYRDAPPIMDKSLHIVESGQHPIATRSQGHAIAQIGSHIRFDAAVLDTFDVMGCEPLHYDMLVLCAAIEFADRRWRRPRGWCRTLNVTIPVSDLDAWQRTDVLQCLHSVLRHLTGDIWRLTFVRATSGSPIGSKQMALRFGKTKAFAMAYSEGLDSRAVSALSGDENEALCVRVSRSRQLRNAGEGHFKQIPFKVENKRADESSFRSRGFQFAAVTALAAQLSGVSRIVVPESGQGALGPVLVPLHNVYADYRNHPTFFRRMERFIKALLDYQVRFEQPRMWSTKGQTLRAFLDLPGKSPRDLATTRSCWQTRRTVNVGKRRQCGLCAACLLRRLSLYTAGVHEAPDTYVVSDLSISDASRALSTIPHKADRNIMVEYGSVGARHFQHLADLASQPDETLRTHASELAIALGAGYADTLRNLRLMLSEHAREWKEFLAAQGRHGFLCDWMAGGRYGRSE